MQLSPVLQAKVKIIAHRYGHGWDGDDLVQDCLCLLWQLPEDKAPQALTICHNLCLDKLKAEEVRATESLEYEPTLYGEVVDVDKYIEHIKNLRLRGIVDQYIDSEKALLHKDVMYLIRHRFELDHDLRRYLKQKSAWQILIDKIEPFRRSFRKLKDQSVRIQMLQAQ